jgi:enoyl-CoA hydratase
MAMSYTIEEQSGGYLLFTIHRVEKRNAISYEVMKGLKEAIGLAQGSHIKALVITGTGDQAFCSGGDLSEFHLLKTKEEAYPMLKEMSEILYGLLTLSKPTVALMNGTAVGGGCELAIACDFRIARKGIKAGFVQGKQAITTGWGGGSILSEKLSQATAMKLLMEGEVHAAEDLQSSGFLDEVFEGNPLDSCEVFLEKILAMEPAVLQAYKSIYIRKWEQSGLKDRIEAEVSACSSLWESEAHHRKVESFLNHKKSAQ